MLVMSVVLLYMSIVLLVNLPKMTMHTATSLLKLSCILQCLQHVYNDKNN